MATNDRRSGGPTTLYRFYGRDGALLYVGITLNPGKRWEKHRDEKPWWTDVTDIKLEQHPTRQAALEAERAAIIAEKPAHNIVHNRTPKAGHRRAARRTVEPAASTTPELSAYSAGPWTYHSLRSGYQHRGPLYLTYEIHLEPILDDSIETIGNYQAEELLRRVRRDGVDTDAVPVYWYVETPHGLELAPHHNLPTEDEGAGWRGLSHPYRSGQQLDWRRLDVVHDRFPAFDAALAWRPAPFTPTCPLAHLVQDIYCNTGAWAEATPWR